MINICQQKHIKKLSYTDDANKIKYKNVVGKQHNINQMQCNCQKTIPSQNNSEPRICYYEDWRSFSIIPNIKPTQTGKNTNISFCQSHSFTCTCNAQNLKILTISQVKLFLFQLSKCPSMIKPETDPNVNKNKAINNKSTQESFPATSHYPDQWSAFFFSSNSKILFFRVFRASYFSSIFLSNAFP